MRVVAFDVETAAPQRHTLLAAGLAYVDDTGTIRSSSTLVHPGRKPAPALSRIHGIWPRDMAHAPAPAAVWPWLTKALTWGTVAMHNAPFDMGVLAASADHHGLPTPSFPYVCSVALAREVWPGLESYSLGLLSATLGLPPFEHHDAEADARQTILLVQRILDEVGTDDIVDAASQLGVPVNTSR